MMLQLPQANAGRLLYIFTPWCGNLGWSLNFNPTIQVWYGMLAYFSFLVNVFIFSQKKQNLQITFALMASTPQLLVVFWGIAVWLGEGWFYSYLLKGDLVTLIFPGSTCGAGCHCHTLFNHKCPLLLICLYLIIFMLAPTSFVCQPPFTLWQYMVASGMLCFGWDWHPHHQVDCFCTGICIDGNPMHIQLQLPCQAALRHLQKSNNQPVSGCNGNI